MDGSQASDLDGRPRQTCTSSQRQNAIKDVMLTSSRVTVRLCDGQIDSQKRMQRQTNSKLPGGQGGMEPVSRVGTSGNLERFCFAVLASVGWKDETMESERKHQLLTAKLGRFAFRLGVQSDLI